MEERDKDLKAKYHINLLDRQFNNQEEPHGWQLENPELIQKPPNEDEETKSNLENEYNYLYLPYITFEEIYGDEAQEIICEDKYLCQLPGANLHKIQLLEVLTEEGIKKNLSNQFLDKTFFMGILPRGGLYFNQIWAQWYLGLNGSTYKTGRLRWVGDTYSLMNTYGEPCPDISTIFLTYIKFEDIFEKEKLPTETVNPHPWKELPGFNLTKYEFLELLTWDGIEGNLGN
ncbi:hypothetical protein O181_099981 [Austropuccinia psidii MF-1]|uniref:Uncharacterized protein n=1 Tax=Austropuccinia psidii MF-1 TaxID=1389203 RepID=A0A9Q3JEH5_9BASI|nr:hypothetical protein [Austropuccinia psidii MF-1]